MHVDIVLEMYHDAIFEVVPLGQKTSSLLGIEVSGSEHGTRARTVRRDSKKIDAVPFAVRTVHHARDEDDAFYYVDEAQRLLDSWWP